MSKKNIFNQVKDEVLENEFHNPTSENFINFKRILIFILLALILVAIGYYIGYNYFVSTPNKTLSQIESAAKTGDFEKFDNCCLNQDKLFDNIQNRLLEDPEFQSPLAKGLIATQIQEAKEDFSRDFKAKESFQQDFDRETIKETSNGFTVEAKNGDGETNLLTFEKTENGYELIDSKTIN